MNFEKTKLFLQENKIPVLASIMTSVATVPAFASVDQQWKPIITALTGGITVADIVTLLAAVIVIGIPFVLMWFGARKGVRAFMAAFRSGKLKF